MGIRFLETYVRSAPNGSSVIDIKREIENWKRNNVGSNPLIVIDAKALEIDLESGRIDRIFGKRYNLIVKKNQAFFDKLKDLQVEIVFFKDGPVQEAKYERFLERKKGKYLNAMDIFDRLKKKQSIKSIMDTKVSGRKDDIPIGTKNIDAIENIYKGYGTLYTSIHHECDVELAQYATQNNALAVISTDTDFLIFEGNWKFWSGRAIDVDKLRTIEFSRSEFRKSVGLSYQQLPLFATVSGNDICRYDDLINFHHWLRCGRYDRFQKIADYVSSKPINLTRTDLIKIADDIWADKAKPEHIKILRDSLNSYNLNFKIKLPDSTLKQKVSNNSFMYKILENIPLTLNLDFFDLRRADDKEFLLLFEIFEPLLRRLMGVICQHKLSDTDSNELKRTIVTKKTHSTDAEAYDVDVLFPKIKVPDLMILTFTENNVDLNPIRWQLLKWIVFDECQIQFQIENLPVERIVGTLATSYLLKLKQITTIEADAILLTNDHIHRDLVPTKIEYLICPDGHDIMVSHLYIRTYRYIVEAMQCLGLEPFIQHLIFDGVYFVNLLRDKKRSASVANSDNNAKYDEVNKLLTQLQL